VPKNRAIIVASSPPIKGKENASAIEENKQNIVMANKDEVPRLPILDCIGRLIRIMVP